MSGEGYPDIETRLIDWLKTTIGVEDVYPGGPTDVPSNLTYILPVVMVDRFGGADAVLSLDVANVDIDVYAATRDSARVLAERIRRNMRLTLVGKILNGATITRVETISAPTVLPFDASTVRRVGAAYRIGVHHPI